MKFTEFKLSDSIQDGLRDVNFTEPTAIQEKAIPVILDGKDLIGTAQTGTGKTGAFVIPLMEKILNSNRDGIKALILSPTRELAKQIDEEIFAIGYHSGISSATVIGGSDFSQQAKALKAGVDIIVATPGRLIDQKKVLNIDFSKTEYLVLDEADRMLDMGFLPDMKKIIAWLPEDRQTLLFSATMPDEIRRLSSEIMKNPVNVETERQKPTESVEQRAYFLRSNQKIPLLKKIFKDIKWDSCIIFTSTKKGTDELQRLLKKEGIKAASIHGDRTQDERNKALQDFKNGTYPVIVATDVLARGIDIKGVSMIVNYDVPKTSDDYIHRIGRSGRYDQTGIAVTFITKRDNRLFESIDRIKDNKIKKITVPDEFNEKYAFSWENDFKIGSNDVKTPKKRERADSSSKGDSIKKPSRKSQDSDQPKKKKKYTSKSKQQREQQKKDHADNQHTIRKPDTTSKKSGSGRNDRKDNTTKKQDISKKNNKLKEKEPITIPPIIEKATARNKNMRKPTKGVWGLIKAMIPKIGKKR
ncbi:MAG: DEAD/DEAH box helicase [Balneolaceae bacterium]